MITDEEFKKTMRSLVAMAHRKDRDPAEAVIKAVSFGMGYREEEIKSGIAVVFDAIHKNNKKDKDGDGK
jgi:hypothetical protein